jgi:hypothetical protein
MTLNAIQQRVQQLTDGIACPYYTGTSISVIASPNPGNLKPNSPLIFVWGATGHEHRLTIPRSSPGLLADLGVSDQAGWKETNHTISLYLYGSVAVSDKMRDRKFTIFIEQVKKVLRMSQAPCQLIDTDVEPNEVSVLMDLGETMVHDYDVDRSLADQRYMRSLCRLDVSATEVFKF